MTQFSSEEYKQFVLFLEKTKSLYDNYIFQGKKYEDAKRLFLVNSQFLEFVVKVRDNLEVPYRSIELDLLAEHLDSWRRQFIDLEKTRPFSSSDKFIFFSKIHFPAKPIQSLLSDEP